MAENRKNISTNSEGEEYPLPDEQEYQEEYNRLQKAVDKARSEGKEIVFCSHD